VVTFLERLKRDPARVRLERLERLQALTEELSAAQTREEVVRVVFEHGLGLVDASGVMLYWERAPGELELLHGVGLSEEFAQRWRRVLADDPLPSAEAYRTGKPLWLATAAEIEAHFPALAELARRGGAEAWAALPLASGGGRGALGLQFPEQRAFDEEERNFVLAVTRQCATAAERARLFDASNRLAERLRQLLGVTSTLSAATTAREIAAGAFRALGALGVCAAEVHGVDGRDRVVLLARHGRASMGRGTPVAVDAPTPAAEVIRTGRAIWLESPDDIAQRYPPLDRERAEKDERAWAVVPLLASGQPLGALVAVFAEPRRLESDDRTYLRLVAQPCAQALERARLFHDAELARAGGDGTGALLASAWAGAPVAFGLLDRELRFVRVNEEFARDDGIAPESHLGKTPAELWPATRADPLLVAAREVLRTGRTTDEAIDAAPPATQGPRALRIATLFPVRTARGIEGVAVMIRGRG
jgi:GAF domain-containing protein